MRQSLEVMFAGVIVLLVASTASRAEEGMWTFDNFPIARGQSGAGHTYRSGVARSRAPELGQVRWLFGGDRLCRRPGDDQQSLCRHLRRQSLDADGQLRRDRLHAARAAKTKRSVRAALAEVLLSITDVTRRMQAAGQYADRARRSPRRAMPRQGGSRVKSAPAMRPGAASWCRSIAEDSSSSMSTASTPTCGSPSHRKIVPRRSAATPTTSTFRASPSTRHSSGCTRTGVRQPRRPTSPGMPHVRPKDSRCSSLEVPVRPSVC